MERCSKLSMPWLGTIYAIKRSILSKYYQKNPFYSNYYTREDPERLEKTNNLVRGGGTTEIRFEELQGEGKKADLVVSYIKLSY